jgi:hypothetical protein
MVGKSTTKPKGTRKPGRHRKGQNLRYINEHRRAKSHVRKIKKHLDHHPSDKVAVKDLAWYETWPDRGTARP